MGLIPGEYGRGIIAQGHAVGGIQREYVFRSRSFPRRAAAPAGSIHRSGHIRLHNSARLLRNPLIHADIN